MSVVAIDVDETLYSFDTAIRDAFFDMAEERDDKSILRMAYSNNQEWRNLVDHDQKLAFEAIERVHSKQDTFTPFPGSEEVVNKIHKSGHSIKYVGARKDIHQDVTEDFLWWNNFPPGELICADPSRGSKLEYIQDCQYLIDDRPRTILEFLNDPIYVLATTHEQDRKVFALWRPYNQNLTEVKNLYLAPTWRGLEFYLKRKGVITVE